jgi:hypothetical protein
MEKPLIEIELLAKAEAGNQEFAGRPGFPPNYHPR